MNLFGLLALVLFQNQKIFSEQLSLLKANLKHKSPKVLYGGSVNPQNIKEFKRN